MNKIISVARFVCILFSYLYSYSFYKRCYAVKRKLYSYWLTREFKSVGEPISISYPIDLLGAKNITLGSNVSLGSRGILTVWENENFPHPEIIFSDGVSIGEEFHISAINSIYVGQNVLMGKKVTITDNSHGNIDIAALKLPPAKRAHVSKGSVVIKDNVWIGDKVCVFSGVTIGENAIVAANSVVTKDVAPNTLVGGVPARLIRIIN